MAKSHQNRVAATLKSHRTSWQQSLTDLLINPEELCEILGLQHYLPEIENAAKLFPLRVPREFIQRMKPGLIDDPLLRQILPLNHEFTAHADYSFDPLDELKANPVPGLLHKYQSRVLITLTSSCAVHCRYCFRRHFPYADNNPGQKGWQAMFDYIRQHPHVDEIILSGGDPLMATDNVIAAFIENIKSLSQIKRIRIHSRLPIVIPSRVTNDLLEILTASQRQVIMVVHCNHAQEIDKDVSHAIAKLKAASIVCFNQAVLLKGVNDNASVLRDLSEVLFALGVIPYYLHLLDKVQGTAHFAVSDEEAKAIYSNLQALLPGYMVPKLVREEAGMLAKTIIMP